MRHETELPDGGMVGAKCPVCGVIVPFAVISVTTTGRWRLRHRVIVDGDATDFVAHLWTHRNPGWDKSDISGVT